MRLRLFLLAALTVIAVSAESHAQDLPNLPEPNSMPALPSNALDENAPINLTPDGPAVVKLDEDAASVIVGNPAHATALLENPRLLMLMPGMPGATKVMALNRQGKAILNRHVFVGAGKSGFKRISRVCSTSDSGNCAPVSMYYCPDKCYETTINETSATIGATGDISNPVTDSPENPSEETAQEGVSDGMSVIQ